ICKRLVVAMGGAFSVASQPGKGSVFAFEIPMEVIEPPEPWPQLALQAARAALAVPGIATRAALGAYLEASGLRASEAATANALIVGDSNGLVGVERADLPRICIAEYGEAAPAELRRSGRADAVLVQPFRRRELCSLLTQLAAGKPLDDDVDDRATHAGQPDLMFTGCRVLVADDSAVNREVAIEALSRLDVSCETVNDGRQ